MLDVGHLAHSIVSATDVYASTISKLHSKEYFELQKPIDNCLIKLSSFNIHYTIHLILTHKAENIV